jgi:hypothetical protein
VTQVAPSADNYLNQTIKNLQTQVASLSTQLVLGTQVYDSNGVIRVSVGVTPPATPASPSVEVGLLTNGDYGVLITDILGNSAEVNPEVISQAAGPFTCSTLAWQTVSGGPSVTVVCGASGNIDIALGALIAPGSSSAGETAWLGVSINGTAQTQPQISVEAPASSGLAQTTYQEWVVSGLTPGTAYTIATLASVSTAAVVATYNNVLLRARAI